MATVFMCDARKAKIGEGDEVDTEWVTLNVGGTKFTTTRTTLTKDPNSILSKMFSDKWNSTNWPRDKTGAYLIDSDPKYFSPLLNFLRRGELIIDNGVSAEGILAEAKYIGIQAVVDLLEPTNNVPPDNGKSLSWEDIGGLEGVKRELQQVVDYTVKYKEKFQKWGVGISKNILLYGPPGCGKTMLARVTANQINANFIWVKCPQLVVGGTDATVVLENEFKRAKAMEPCIVFLEEFECIAQVKGQGDRHSDGLINHMAILLDSITASPESIFVFAATNRPDIIEPALLRPGRFDQLIYIPMPDVNAREAILRAALRKMPLCDSTDLKYLATHTNGFSGADLKEICQRACKFAIRESIEQKNETIITRSHLEIAMSYCRRSVSDKDVYRYEHFNQMLQKISSRTFTFPD